MSISVLTNVSLVYNSVDLSNHVESVEIDMSYDDVEVTAMGGTTHSFVPGLRNDSIKVTFYQDFGNATVYTTIEPLLGSSAGASLVIKPVASSVSTTNPSYTVVAAPFTWQPLSGSVGEASKTEVEFRPIAGGYIVKAVT